jgi:hypothetical protein
VCPAWNELGFYIPENGTLHSHRRGNPRFTPTYFSIYFFDSNMKLLNEFLLNFILVTLCWKLSVHACPTQFLIHGAEIDLEWFLNGP